MPLCNEDLKNESGKWVLRWGSMEKGTFTQTRIGKLHNAMTQRGKPGGSHQRTHPSYLGVTVAEEWLDPQRFGDWCVRQKGWGLGYDLDKDLLVPGNKVYGPDFCVFLPGRINSVIAGAGRPGKAGRLRGVYPNAKTGMFAAQLIVDKKIRKLGLYQTAEEAHEVYCAHKAAMVRELANQCRDTIDQRAYNALMLWEVNEKILVIEKNSAIVQSIATRETQ